MGARLQVEEAKERSQEALERAADSTWLERLARAGLVSRGLLYIVVALLALQVARGHGDTRADKQGALHTVVHEPFGKVLVLALAVGFAGYAAWRFVEAAVGPSGEDDARKAALKRIGYAARGGLYAFFSLSAAKLLVSSSGDPGSDNSEADWTRRVLDWPGGRWLVGAVGLVVIGSGLYVGWRGLARKFRKGLKSFEMGPVARRWILGVGMVGMVARMLVTVLIGAFLVVAAADHDPNQAVGIDGALKRLADRSFGPPLLALVALGFLAYGLYSLAEARYRRVGSS
ncbi:MAG TPA: DUF1206 domain-containing protein [Acidimicrobiales bacterium]|jgi:hypothetical protein|nr:DUF1206 domain-containing protein [Acidimicrobiales bacterium]